MLNRMLKMQRNSGGDATRGQCKDAHDNTSGSELVVIDNP